MPHRRKKRNGEQASPERKSGTGNGTPFTTEMEKPGPRARRMPQAKVPGTRDVMEGPKTPTQKRQHQEMLRRGFERL